MKTEEDLSTYERSALQQNELWLQGISLHNNVTGECCVDFSCCYPDLFLKDYSKRLKRVNYLRNIYGLEDIFQNSLNNID